MAAFEGETGSERERERVAESGQGRANVSGENVHSLPAPIVGLFCRTIGRLGCRHHSPCHFTFRHWVGYGARFYDVVATQMWRDAIN